MPNWCENEILLITTTEELDKVITSIISKEGSSLFQSLILTNREKYYRNSPIPHIQDRMENDKYFDWYNHNIEEYGTKSDVSDFYYDNGTLSFQTAWSPCKEFVQKLSEQYGIKVRLEYSELGNDFAGHIIYDNGVCIEEEEDTYYEYYTRHNYDIVLIDLCSDDEFLEIQDEEEQLKFIEENYSSQSKYILDLYLEHYWEV